MFPSTETLRLTSGESVFIPTGSHLLFHENDGIRTLLAEALTKINSTDADPNGLIEKEVNFSSIVGECNCVETGPDDKIIFAYRMGKDRDGQPKLFDGPSRFVKGRAPEPCSSLFIVLKAINEVRSEFKVVTGFVGKKPTREPWDKYLSDDAMRTSAKKYWSNHALVLGAFPIDKSTVSNSVPPAFQL